MVRSCDCWHPTHAQMARHPATHFHPPKAERLCHIARIEEPGHPDGSVVRYLCYLCERWHVPSLPKLYSAPAELQRSA